MKKTEKIISMGTTTRTLKLVSQLTVDEVTRIPSTEPMETVSAIAPRTSHARRIPRSIMNSRFLAT